MAPTVAWHDPKSYSTEPLYTVLQYFPVQHEEMTLIAWITLRWSEKCWLKLSALIPILQGSNASSLCQGTRSCTSPHLSQSITQPAPSPELRLPPSHPWAKFFSWLAGLLSSKKLTFQWDSQKTNYDLPPPPQILKHICVSWLIRNTRKTCVIQKDLFSVSMCTCSH